MFAIQRVLGRRIEPVNLLLESLVCFRMCEKAPNDMGQDSRGSVRTGDQSEHAIREDDRPVRRDLLRAVLVTLEILSFGKLELTLL